jgi:hypothetical protein
VPRFEIVLPSEIGAPPGDLEFGEFLRVCLDKGIRPGKGLGEKWGEKRFAGAVEVTDKTIDNYLKNEHPPRYPPIAVEKALFGDEDPQYLAEWRQALRTALMRTRARKAAERKRQSDGNAGSNLDPVFREQTRSSDLPGIPPPLEPDPIPADTIVHTSSRALSHTLLENGPMIVGAVGIAQGLVHLVYVLTSFLSESFEKLLQDPWVYGDLGFGVGGVIIGLGCIRLRWWAKESGICFCILALLCAYLWFADKEYNSDVTSVVWAFNLLNPPTSTGALCYFLFGWPDKKRT